MKVWLDKNYNIAKDDGNNIFGRGNNLFDYISVYMLTESIGKDNTLPMFNFLLANGRSSGVRVHNQATTVEGEYTVFTYKLENMLLSVPGAINITIVINWYNASDKAVMTKHVTVIGSVVNNVVISDDVFILTEDNGEEIVKSLVADIEAINNRLNTFESFKINQVDATVDNSVGVPEVEVVESGGAKAPNYTFNFRNIKGEKGDKGEQGIQGEKGDKGDDGITDEVKGFYALMVDEESGMLYTIADDTEEAPVFEYDQETGHLYIVLDDEGYTEHLRKGDDLVYGAN